MKLNHPIVFEIQPRSDQGTWVFRLLITTFIMTLALVSHSSDVAAQGQQQHTNGPMSKDLSAREIRGSAAVVPLTSEPAARLVVDAPLPDQLALGRVVLQYRTENLRIVPVYGPAALDVSPRIGHLHITVDSAPWRWVDASNEPLIINGLSAGPHHILVEMVDANHKVIEGKTIKFTIPELEKTGASYH